VTMSRRLIRQGTPSITSRQPSQRLATLSSTIVSSRIPMISIGAILAGEPLAGTLGLRRRRVFADQGAHTSLVGRVARELGALPERRPDTGVDRRAGHMERPPFR